MTIQHVPLENVLPNPWQTREALDPAYIAELAADIKANGLLQTPRGRPAPKGLTQLAFGHNRLAAFRKLADEWTKAPNPDDQLNPWATIPVDVALLTDREMSDHGAAENGARKDLSPIEIAHAIQRRMDDFHIGKLEAAAPFHIESRPGVDNLLSLVKLPAAIQALVQTGELRQAPARSLITIARWNEAAAVKIATAAVKHDPEDRMEAIDSGVASLLREKAVTLRDHSRPWPVLWPAKPLPLTDFDQSKGEPKEIPSCSGCEFAVRRDGEVFCIRPACFAAKSRLWLQSEVAAASQRTGIAVAAPGERVTLVFGGSYDYRAQGRAEKVIKAKLDCLRLAPNPEKHGSHTLKELLGSEHVILMTTDTAAVEKVAGSADGKPKKAVVKSANETPLQAERRKVAEKELSEERALERMAYNRSKADILWLVEHTAALIAERTVAGGGLLVFAIDQNRAASYNVSPTVEMIEAAEALAKRAGLDKVIQVYGDTNIGKLGRAATPEIDQVRRQYLAYRKLTRDVASGHNATDVYGDLAKARKTCQSVAVNTFGVELPEGWDTPPIHHTPINCWTCGRFSAAGAGKLTQGDIKEGWSTDKDGSVRCPEHATSKTLSAVFDPMADKPDHPLVVKMFNTKLPPKPDRRTSAGRMATHAAIRAKAIAERIKKDVPSHTRPAPKPSAKKKPAPARAFPQKQRGAGKKAAKR